MLLLSLLSSFSPGQGPRRAVLSWRLQSASKFPLGTLPSGDRPDERSLRCDLDVR